MYSWPTLVLPRFTQHIAIYSFVFYVLTYFAVFRWMMTVYPILTALTGFQVSNLDSPRPANPLSHRLELTNYSATHRPTVATESLGLPANVSHNTQGPLDELPLDVSNIMD
ncbi:hypothetical protein DSO57_1029481 [Entomophthora muscae]|uniref:Uncharacterized protein n=1 Tax=Entomophthora muscae TaxID=34485 RepID=A0ACC2SQ88_9FUNG|nr:hypothetical protein DSO57_1029481 [Entomophthora muscae]